MNLYKFHSDPKSLDLHDQAHEQVPELAWKKYRGKTKEMKKRESLWAKNAQCAFEYTTEILNSPFPAGEAAIATDADYAYNYAKYVLYGPFPAGEAAIAADADYAYMYAKYVLKGPFPAGEEAISSNPLHLKEYEALKAKWEAARGNSRSKQK